MPKATNSGGKRQGTGRKPKALTVTPEVNKHELSVANMDLQPNQVAAVAMLARGMKQKRVAEQLGVAENTVITWKQNPAFQQALQQLQDRMLNDVNLLLDPLVPKAFARLEQILDLELDDAKDLNASQIAVLGLQAKTGEGAVDRKHGKAIVRQASANVSHVTINIVSNKESDAGVFVEKDEYTEGEFTEVDPVY
jgi:transcriptional regulator with XRE-family HTH domain